MDKDYKKVAVLACSGIGKTLGAVARETTIDLVERVRPGTAVTTCLGLVVSDDPEAKRLITDNPVITIDGCNKECSKKSVLSQGGKLARSYQAMDFLKKHKGIKPEGISELNEAGQLLASLAADEIAEVIDKLLAEEGKQ